MPLLRAGFFALTQTALGMAAHHVAADGPVEWGRGGVAVAVLWVAVWIVAHRGRSSLPVHVAVGASSQALLHHWLAAAGHSAHQGGLHHVPADLHAVGHERLHDSMSMAAAHGLVAVLIAVLLQRADVALFRLATGLRDASRAVLAPFVVRPVLDVPVAPVHAEAVRRTRSPGTDTFLTDTVVRRGPPDRVLPRA
ncbi:hypothetical protein [Streptomyces sp. NPDC085540]|uniref:hypothetical protein n=1 Tax=Streptomyces sp. NPDC085540 TaxID=3365730 RepID=UPI0037D15E41